MGGRVAPTNFPQPGAIGSAQQGSNAVMNPSAGQQPTTKLGAFNPAAILPTQAAPPPPPPAPAPATNRPFQLGNPRNQGLAFGGSGGLRRGISMSTDY